MAQEKSKKGASTQEHLPFTAVFQDTLILKDGNYRQILLVSSINFGLKSEEEQNAILYAYQSFLNSLTFPVQILTQSRQIDLSDYVASLKQKIYQQRNELIRYQTQEYIDFVGRLIQVANIMDKKFFIVIPYIKTDVKTGLFAPKHGYLQVSLQEFEKIKTDLQQKADVVSQGLATLGLKTVKLTTEQIIELLYASYNVTQSLRKKIQNSEALAESTVVQQTEGGDTIDKEPEETPAEKTPSAQGQTPPPAQAPSDNVKVPINQG
ncbi:MAG TPA: hypothetical protein PLC05_01035 [bacterium]|nr:hypothetical protein [bacterium]